jgi:hypothetical protein
MDEEFLEIDNVFERSVFHLSVTFFNCFGRLSEDFQNIQWPKTAAQLTTEPRCHTPLGNKCMALFHAF